MTEHKLPANRWVSTYGIGRTNVLALVQMHDLTGGKYKMVEITNHAGIKYFTENKPINN